MEISLINIGCLKNKYPSGSLKLIKNTMSQRYAFFDFDGTLTRVDSVLPFLKFCYQNNFLFYLKLIVLIPNILAYFLGYISNAVIKEKIIHSYLNGWHIVDIQVKAAEFTKLKLPNILRPEGMQLLAKHIDQGDICVLVSASPDWYLHPWGKQHGFSMILGTKMMVTANKLNGQIDGENCHHFAKVNRINKELGESCWDDSIAYSDSRVDLPMLQHAKQGYLFNTKTKTFELI